MSRKTRNQSQNTLHNKKLTFRPFFYFFIFIKLKYLIRINRKFIYTTKPLFIKFTTHYLYIQSHSSSLYSSSHSSSSSS